MLFCLIVHKLVLAIIRQVLQNQPRPTIIVTLVTTKSRDQKLETSVSITRAQIGDLFAIKLKNLQYDSLDFSDSDTNSLKTSLLNAVST